MGDHHHRPNERQYSFQDESVAADARNLDDNTQHSNASKNKKSTMGSNSPPASSSSLSLTTTTPPSSRCAFRQRRWLFGLGGFIFLGLLFLNKDAKRVSNSRDFSSTETKVVTSSVDQEASAKKEDHHELSPIGSLPLHAADALQCRESVVSFVLYATDAKDECEGLKKAFDKTCGNDPEDPATKEAKAQRRRRLTHKQRRSVYASWKAYQQEWRLWAWQTRQYVEKIFCRLWDVDGENASSNLFTEDDIVGKEAWDAASYLVEHDLDGIVHQPLLQKWLLERQEARGQRHLTEVVPSVVNQSKKEHAIMSLDLPTANKHASEMMVQETLLLQQGDKLLEMVANASAAQHQHEEDKVDAAKSGKAMSDATAVVSAFLNDPSSVEARRCCASILNVYHENCSNDDEEEISDSRLFFVVFVMALCGVTKSLIRHFKLLWLPEAAGCILVGVFSGYLMMLFPHHDPSFDGNWFLRIMVPPIVFEAALGIDKNSFHRHLVPILFYAIAGTLVATLLTALIVNRGTHFFSGLGLGVTPIPFIEALTFGALISSIDPIAVLSVLSNMGMTDADTIYVVIFGESLLNDGVAIVLFDTLVHFLDENLIIDRDAIVLAAIHFTVVALGSLLIGVASGMCSTIYFYAFHGCQTPLVEVLMFFCWALLPYYVCDGIGWSGIVSAVATGFVMDIHIVGPKEDDTVMTDFSEVSDLLLRSPKRPPNGFERGRRRIFFSFDGQLSTKSKLHINFVAELIATAMETAIFAYLGLFLFSHRYHWNLLLALIAILACAASRAIMIPILSLLANSVTRMQQKAQSVCKPRVNKLTAPLAPTGVVIDTKMQLVLWFAGLRGAMSFALVEHIPLYDFVSGEGTRFKPELKAMTSASILFTVFVLGGYTYYVMDHLGMAPSTRRGASKPSTPDLEMSSLLTQGASVSAQDSNDSEEDGGSVPSREGQSRRRARAALNIDNGHASSRATTR